MTTQPPAQAPHSGAYFCRLNPAAATVFLKIDRVVHCGESMRGWFVYVLVSADVGTVWTGRRRHRSRDSSWW